MATFNPNTDVPNPDWTRASQGQRGDSSLGTLFDGAGNLLDKGIKAKDAYIKKTIDEDITAGVDQLRDREMNLGARAEGYGDRTDPIAKRAIDQNIDRIGLAKNSAKSGQIGDSHYQLLLDAEARRLRASHPGYRDYIDNKISDLTGGTPANKAIELLKQELKKEDKENSALNNEYHWAREHGGPLQEALAGGQRPDLTQAQKWNYTHAKQLSDAKLITSQINVENLQDESSKKKNFERFRDIANSKLRVGVNAATDSFGQQDWKDILAKNQELGEQKAKGPTDPKTEAAFRDAVNRFEINQTDAFNKQLYGDITLKDGTKTTWANVIGEANVEKYRKEFTASLEAQTKPFKDKDWSRVAHNAMNNKATEDANIARLVSSNEYAANMQAAKKIIPEQVLLSMHYRSPQGLAETDIWYKNHILSTAFGKGLPFNQASKEVENIMKQGGYDDQTQGKVKAAALDAALHVLKTTPPENRAPIVSMLFGGDPRFNDFYSDKTSPSTKNALYDRLVNGETAKAVMASPDDAAKGKYTAWVNRVVGQRMLSDVSDIRDTVFNIDNRFGLKVNPDTLEFSTVGREGAKGSSMNRLAVVRIESNLNQTIKGWKAVARSTGLSDADMKETIRSLMLQHGIEIKHDGTLSQLSNMRKPNPADLK